MKYFQMVPFLFFAMSVDAENLGESSSAPVTAVPRSAPAGYESFFPEGYTAPKMSVGSGTAVVVGPTPFFKKKEMNSSAPSVKSAQATKLGQDPTQQSLDLKDGNTELMVAATTGNLNAVKVLLGKGVNVNQRNKFGSTALMGAAAAGEMEIVELLLKKGADPNAKGKGGSTALIFAAKNGFSEIVSVLVKAGGDPAIKDNSGQTFAGFLDKKTKNSVETKE